MDGAPKGGTHFFWRKGSFFLVNCCFLASSWFSMNSFDITVHGNPKKRGLFRIGGSFKNDYVFRFVTGITELFHREWLRYNWLIHDVMRVRHPGWITATWSHTSQEDVWEQMPKCHKIAIFRSEIWSHFITSPESPLQPWVFGVAKTNLNVSTDLHLGGRGQHGWGMSPSQLR